MGEPFLGVSLENINDLPSESAPDVAKPDGATDNAPEVGKDHSEKPEATEVDKPAPVAAKPDLVDLDKLERVRWKGRELSLKEIDDAAMRHEDYTRKVQQVSETRKYADNFAADLDKVVATPALIEQMRKIYPAQYVKAAESVLSRLRKKEEPESEPVEAAIPPEYAQKLEELTSWKTSIDSKIEEANLVRAEKTIDGWFDSLAKKFPEADTEVVNAKAVYLAEQLEADGKTITEKHLEKIFKDEHDRMDKRFNDRYRSQFEQQKAAAAKAKDIGAGGGVPSAPPIKAKTIKEATAQLLSDAQAGRI